MNRLLAIAVIPFVCLAIGCPGESGPKLYPTSGTIKLAGVPVAGASVTFLMDNGQVATAITGQDGKYKLDTLGKDGCPAGNAKVSVSKYTTEGGNQMPASPKPEDMMKMGPSAPGAAPLRKNELPEKYSDPSKSNLKAEVKEKGDNSTNDFDLVP